MRYYLLKVRTLSGHRIVQVLAESEAQAIKEVQSKLYPGSTAWVDKRPARMRGFFGWPLLVLLLCAPSQASPKVSLAPLFRQQEVENAIPKGLLSAVCWVESSHKQKKYPHYDGGSFSYGVCHVKIGTARQVGYTGPVNQLQRPENSILVAARYLKHCLEKSNGDRNKALTAYNAGTHNKKRFKRSSRYVALVLIALKEGR